MLIYYITLFSERTGNESDSDTQSYCTPRQL